MTTASDDTEASDVTTYECQGCGRTVYPDLAPSPREADGICSSCFWTEDDGGDAA